MEIPTLYGETTHMKNMALATISVIKQHCEHFRLEGLFFFFFSLAKMIAYLSLDVLQFPVSKKNIVLPKSMLKG